MDDRSGGRLPSWWGSLLAVDSQRERSPPSGHPLLRRGLHRAMAGTAIALLLFGVAVLVYLTGGSRFSTLHLAYLPIIAAGVLLGAWSGVGAGILAGLLVGPYMPLNVEAGLPQELSNWLIRLGFFMLAGYVAGALTSLVRRQEARLRWLALHSPDSGLPNLESLINDLSWNLAQRTGNNRYALLLVQINNYEDIISALGAQFGAEIRGAVARRLQAVQVNVDSLLGGQPQADRVYDMRGNKVAVLLPNPDELLESFVQRLRRLPDRLLSIDEVPIYTDLSVGAVVVGYQSCSPEELVQRANIAVNEARRRGDFFVPYAYEDDQARKRNLRLLARLPKAIQRGELRLEYQPKVDLHTGAPLGAEALVRWQHPYLGRVSPGDFIPLAEQTALMHPLTQWVVREATGYVADLHGAGHKVAIAVNISPKNLEDSELFDQLGRLIKSHRLAAGCIELEITESAILNSSPRLIDMLSELRAQGVQVAIDDFGAGYTSLSHLAELPVDCLKIDRIFVTRLTRSWRDRNIVGSVIDLARRLNLSTVAEGIEDQPTADLLLEMGCDVGQGFFFARPLPPVAFEPWLERAARAHTPL